MCAGFKIDKRPIQSVKFIHDAGNKRSQKGPDLFCAQVFFSRREKLINWSHLIDIRLMDIPARGTQRQRRSVSSLVAFRILHFAREPKKWWMNAECSGARAEWILACNWHTHTHTEAQLRQLLVDALRWEFAGRLNYVRAIKIKGEPGRHRLRESHFSISFLLFTRETEWREVMLRTLAVNVYICTFTTTGSGWAAERVARRSRSVRVRHFSTRSLACDKDGGSV